ncbi:MAG TPA: TonB family protein [Candidatus Omnitrophota bacterium]|nr:TonB family protein [Candidatus Omnitrophota bacterium]
MGTKKALKTIILALLVGASCFATAAGGAEQASSEFDSSYLEELHMIKGELVSVKVYGLTRVSVTDPDIADIADAKEQEILLVGKREGQTALFIWDEKGKRTVMVQVYLQDLDRVKTRVQKILTLANINEVSLSINEQEGKVYATGEVPEHKQEKFDEVIGMFADHIVDLTGEEVIDDLVQVDMQITELSTTLTESLGIDWSTGGMAGLAPQYQETVPEFDGSISDWFKIGDFNRAGQLVAQVNALITEGKGRILSKPKLVVISGKEASFLVGGEIPIRTTTFSDAGSSQENVEFKEYGVSMTITPTIRKEKIDLTMNLEVSDIDASTATTISEDVAFSTRSASTHLLLDDGQTIVLAGLIKNSKNETKSKIPFFGDIPVVGLLFRSRVNPVPQTDQELVIALTPRILKQKKPSFQQSQSGATQQSDAQKISSPEKYYSGKTSPYYLGIPKEMTGYVSEVQRKISQAIVYPQEARQYGWEGTVKLGVLILNDGTLAFALVKESSGHEVFDEVALNTAKKLAPFSAFPPETDLQELNITIPIVYSLQNK